MPSDLPSLLAAVVADPSDDVARLVYADCLEEHGNAARAAFIRLQIEAERHHPDSNAREALEAQAWGLFERHWVEWWGEVCAAVGLPPAVEPGGGIWKLAKLTNHKTDFRIIREEVSLAGPSAIFSGGFPDFAAVGKHLPVWTNVSPLRGIILASDNNDLGGTHLGTVQAVELYGYNLSVLDHLFQATHLNRLESLRIEEGIRNEHMYLNAGFAADLARTLDAPRVRRLKRLSVHLENNLAAEALAAAVNLSGLESLEVPILDCAGDPDDRQAPGRALLTLARSPNLAGLKELIVPGGLEENGFTAAIQNPCWVGLQRLAVDVRYCDLNTFSDADNLEQLKELRLTSFNYTSRNLAALRRSPLLKRLRHFAVQSVYRREAEFDIADAVDADRIETFAIGINDATPRVVAMLRARFGDKLCLLPT